MCAVLAFTSCKSSESAYFKAYEKEVQQQETATIYETKDSVSAVTESFSANNTVANANTVTVEEENRKSGLEWSYLAIENGWGFGINLCMNNFVLGFNNMFGETNKYVETNESWSLQMGYNGRHWLSKAFYIEGRFGLQYTHSKFEMKGSKAMKDDNIGLFLTPRIGLALGKGFAITGGYEWDFNEFKFDKKHTNDFFTVGISLLM